MNRANGCITALNTVLAQLCYAVYRMIYVHGLVAVILSVLVIPCETFAPIIHGCITGAYNCLNSSEFTSRDLDAIDRHLTTTT